MFPRTPGDGFTIDSTAWSRPKPTRAELDANAEAIRAGARLSAPRNRSADRRVVEAVTAVPPPLTEARLLVAVRELAAADPALGAVVERFGPPPLWAREPGFPTLVHLILEQQVSLASAQAAFDRLEPPPTR